MFITALFAMLLNLEPIIQSEVSQKEKKQISYINSYIESRKMILMNISAGQQWRHRQRTDLWTQVGKERWDESREQH